MALTITGTRISSDVPGCDTRAELGESGWTVTANPGRTFTRDQAVTAMVLAEVYATNPPPQDRIWWHVPNWRRELGLGPHTDDPSQRGGE